MPSTAACEAAGQHGTIIELKCSDPVSLAEVHALNADHSIDAAQVTEMLYGEKGVRVHGAWIKASTSRPEPRMRCRDRNARAPDAQVTVKHAGIRENY
jgi:hypothetical protein